MTTTTAARPTSTLRALPTMLDLPEGWSVKECTHTVIPFLTDPSGYCPDAGPGYRHGRYDNFTPRWALTRAATGWTIHFTSPAVAERFAAKADADDQCKLMAEYVLSNELSSEEGVRRARRALAIHEGRMVDGPADSLCECGGLLTHAGGAYLHVDRCESCLHLPEGATCPDTDGLRHLVCRVPAPVQCEHHHCRRPNVIEVEPCDRDKICCGNH